MVASYVSRPARILIYKCQVPVSEVGLVLVAVAFGIAGMTVSQFIIAFIAVAAAALQMRLRQRGQVSLMFLVMCNFVG